MVRKLSSKKRQFSIINGVDVILFLVLFIYAFLGGFKIMLGQINFHGDWKVTESHNILLKSEIHSFTMSLN